MSMGQWRPRQDFPALLQLLPAVASNEDFNRYHPCRITRMTLITVNNNLPVTSEGEGGPGGERWRKGHNILDTHSDSRGVV
jgi:hypothetical protein